MKFQTFISSKLATEKAGLAEYQKSQKAESQLNMLEKYELASDDFRRLKKYADAKGIEISFFMYLFD